MTQPGALWHDLVATALIGTARQTPQLPQGDDALGNTFDKLNQAEPEHTLLSAAATLALYRRAGQRPTADTTPLPEPSEPDSLPLCTARAAQHLRLMLSGTNREVLPEWLAAAAAAGQRVPAEHLAGLLELGHKQSDLRAAIVPVLDTRGHWLAAQNPEWHYVSAEFAAVQTIEADAEHTTLWETGGRSIRLALLTELRNNSPDAARTLVESTWGTEKLDDRKRFLEQFTTGLSMTDEPFLEAALDDRSKEVRRIAADLLARLPDARLVQRMISRVTPLLTWTSGEGARLKLLSGRKAQLDVTLPAEYDTTMARDSIERHPPHKKIGEKAWWLQQILGSVPPAYWCQTWQTTPSELVDIAMRDKEWRDMLIQGWLTAACRHADVDWIEAILMGMVEKAAQVNIQQAFTHLSPQRQEKFLLRMFEKHRDALKSDRSTLWLLRETHHTWSSDLTRTVLDSLRRLMNKKDGKMTTDWSLRSTLPEFALRIPTELASEIAANWPTNAPGWSFWESAIEQMSAILTFRQEMLKEFRQ